MIQGLRYSPLSHPGVDGIKDMILLKEISDSTYQGKKSIRPVLFRCIHYLGLLFA